MTESFKLVKYTPSHMNANITLASLITVTRFTVQLRAARRLKSQAWAINLAIMIDGHFSSHSQLNIAT